MTDHATRQLTVEHLVASKFHDWTCCAGCILSQYHARIHRDPDSKIVYQGLVIIYQEAELQSCTPICSFSPPFIPPKTPSPYKLCQHPNRQKTNRKISKKLFKYKKIKQKEQYSIHNCHRTNAYQLNLCCRIHSALESGSARGTALKQLQTPQTSKPFHSGPRRGVFTDQSKHHLQLYATQNMVTDPVVEALPRLSAMKVLDNLPTIKGSTKPPKPHQWEGSWERSNSTRSLEKLKKSTGAAPA